MPHQLTLLFKAFRLQFHSGLQLLSPLMDRNTMHVNTNMTVWSGQYAQLLEKEILGKGLHRYLLNELNDVAFDKTQLTIAFPAARDGIRFPEFTLDFDVFYQKRGEGYWGLVPVLGLEAYGETVAMLLVQLEEVVRMDFSRKKKMQHMHELISTIWWSATELVEHEQYIYIPTPRELENEKDADVKVLLSKVAHRLQINEQQVFEREKEMKTLLSSVQSTYQQNILLVGLSGVGKTALVKELAFRTKDAENSIWMTTASTLIKEFAGGEVGWETNLSDFCTELEKTKDYLFISNLKELFEVGQYLGNEVSMAEFLIPFLKKGSIRIISECTEEELSKIDLRSPLYLSYFQIIKIQTPEKGLDKMIQQKFQTGAYKDKTVRMAPAAIAEILRLNQRFSPYSGLPGKPIRFLESILMGRKNNPAEKMQTINRKEVIRQFSEESGLPLFIIDPEIPMDILAIKNSFNEQIHGQARAVDIVVDKLASVKTALTRTGKPIASFLFVGPTGVGKTELAKVLSRFMFGHQDKMIRFDMSEYASLYAVERLIGDTGGADGQLTSAVRQNPFCVLLFDEIEKAHSSVYDLFLQILGDGRLTDQFGKVVNFCSSIIILTSNIGAGNLQGNRISWKPTLDAKEVMQFFDTAVQQFFRPELYNRIDQVIPFAALDKDTMRFVVEREISLLKKLEGIRFKNMQFKVDQSVIDYFAEVGYHSKYGARYLQRSIRDRLTAPLASTLNNFDQEDRLIVEVTMNKGVLKINAEADPLAVDLYWETLEQITNADYISEIRRQLINMQEGNSYIRLLNQLDIYEEQRRKQKDDFFTDKKNARDYTLLSATKDKLEHFSNKVMALEQRFDMSVLGLQDYDPEMEAELDSCKDEFFDIKLEIYGRLHPEVNSCQLGIFGEKSWLPFELYKFIFKSKNFNFRVHSVWFRDRWYNEEIKTTHADTGAEVWQKREAYLMREEKGDLKKQIKAEELEDILVGLAIDVQGPCVEIFLRSLDNTFLEWQLSSEEKYLYLIQVASGELAPPENIHRKTFFNKVLPTLFIQEGHLRDNKTGINREVKKWSHGEWIQLNLEESFKQLVEQLV